MVMHSRHLLLYQRKTFVLMQRSVCVRHMQMADPKYTKHFSGRLQHKPQQSGHGLAAHYLNLRTCRADRKLFKVYTERYWYDCSRQELGVMTAVLQQLHTTQCEPLTGRYRVVSPTSFAEASIRQCLNRPTATMRSVAELLCPLVVWCVAVITN